MGKRIIMLTVAVFAVAALSAQHMAAEKDVIDVGKIGFKQPVTVKFNIRNTDKTPLKIRDVKTNCGCTVAAYPKNAIPAGQTFKIAATYDAKQMGHFEKILAVYVTGEEKPQMLRLKGVVVEKVEKPVVSPVNAVVKPDAGKKGKKSKKKKKDKKKDKQKDKQKE